MKNMILATQAFFWLFYYMHYILSPKTAHAIVSYLESEAVKTYTHAIHDYDKGTIPEWKTIKLG